MTVYQRNYSMELGFKIYLYPGFCKLSMENTEKKTSFAYWVLSSLLRNLYTSYSIIFH